MSFSKFFPKMHKYILPIGFSIIILMMIATNLFAISQMTGSSESMIHTVKKKITNNQLLGKMTQASFDRSMILGEMIQTEDPFRNDELFLELNELATVFTTTRAKFENQELDETMQSLLEEQGRLSRTLTPIQNNIYELLQLDEKTKAVLIFNNDSLVKQHDVHRTINEMTAHQYSSVKETFDEIEKDNNQIISTVLFLNFASLLVSILLTLFVLRKQKYSENKLAILANTDSLTRLPNRASFIYNVDDLIKKTSDSIFAIVFFDIDHFKSINDSYGHEVGDEILKTYAIKIKSLIKNGDALSRFGGDEFVLLLRSIKSKEEANDFIDILSKQLDTSCIIEDKEIFLTSSIGVSIYSNDGSDAKTLLKNADIAMYSAKESGRNCYKFFSNRTRDKIEKGHAITYALHKILKSNNTENELSLKFQPLLNISKNTITECEALLRWNTTDGIEIPTTEFIAHAEKSNLIEKVNDFVIDESCQQQKHWQELEVTDIKININLSGNKKIFAKSLVRLENKIKELDLLPSQFGIELTERTVLEVSERTIKKLIDLRKAGMKIAIDDFGTGYSSLSYLKKLPITTIKIDKSFIAGLPDDKNDRELVKTIIILGHTLNLDIVAEGVENQEQLDYLKTHNCDIAQGFYFHHPLGHDQITELKTVA